MSMELRVFDKAIEPLGAIDELASLIWRMKYFDVGTFSLLAPITDNNSKLLIEGNIIVKHDGKKEVTDAAGGIWRRAAQITYVHITKDENGSAAEFSGLKISSVENYFSENSAISVLNKTLTAAQKSGTALSQTKSGDFLVFSGAYDSTKFQIRTNLQGTKIVEISVPDKNLIFTFN